jgi:hypothetical protein
MDERRKSTILVVDKKALSGFRAKAPGVTVVLDVLEKIVAKFGPTPSNL